MVASAGAPGWRAFAYPLLALVGLLVCFVYLLSQEQLIALDPAGFAGGGVALQALFWSSALVLLLTWLLALFFALRLWRRGAFSFKHDNAGRGIALRLTVLVYLVLLGLVSLLAWRYWADYAAYLQLV